MNIRVTRYSSGWFAQIVGSEMDGHGAGSTAKLAIERLIAALPERFGAASESVQVERTQLPQTVLKENL